MATHSSSSPIAWLAEADLERIRGQATDLDRVAGRLIAENRDDAVWLVQYADVIAILAALHDELVNLRAEGKI